MKHAIYKHFSESLPTVGVLSRRTYDRLLVDVWEAELDASTDTTLRLRLIELLSATGFDTIPNSLEAIDQRILDVLKEKLRHDFGMGLRLRLVDLLYGPNLNHIDEVSRRRQLMAKLFDDRLPAAQS